MLTSSKKKVPVLYEVSIIRGLQEMEVQISITKAELDKMDDKDKDWAEQLQEGYDHLDKKSRKNWLCNVTENCRCL